MSDKQVRLFILGAGDAHLQSLIEQGMAALGADCSVSELQDEEPTAMLDAITPDTLPIIIKPPL